MSILNVEHLTHGFGDRAIFQDVSFRLLKGEHIGLVGANGEGKSTFFNIVTDKLMPDEGKIQWAKNVRVGYLDQHSVLSQGMTIRDVLEIRFFLAFRAGRANEYHLRFSWRSFPRGNGSSYGGAWNHSGYYDHARFLHNRL